MVKNDHWLWSYMTEQEFSLMDSEMDIHAQGLTGDALYYMMKAIEQEHTHNATERLKAERRKVLI